MQDFQSQKKKPLYNLNKVLVIKVSKIIIGLTGSFGSGCTHLAEKYLEPQGYKRIRLSSIISKMMLEENQNGPKGRDTLQEYGNKLRSEKGSDFLASEAIKEIKEDENSNWVIDSIKNHNEVKCFRERFSNFYLIGIYADYETRWERLKMTYDENEKVFKEHDKKDIGEDEEFGQHVRDCFNISDIIISNNINYHDGNKDQKQIEDTIKEYLKLINEPPSRPPKQEEAIMAMAYANSQRSSCNQRKVGAVIVDKNGNIFSSGYNEVPMGERPCKHAYGTCYRKYVKNGIKQKYDIPAEVLKDFKNLDRCRALHAEENAIINVAINGGSLALKGSTLYTTTYPCNLCANKIAQVGIKEIYYMEPYPQEEAKKILTDFKVKQTPFEGVSFKGYFKFFGGEVL